MKREDFKKITAQHFESCEEIIRMGNCVSAELGISVNCSACPFTSANNIQHMSCEAYYCSEDDDKLKDEKLVASAKEFLKFRDSDLGGVAMNILNKKPINLKLKDELIKRLNNMKVGDVIETKKYAIECEEDMSLDCDSCYFKESDCVDIMCSEEDTLDSLHHSFKVRRRWN